MMKKQTEIGHIYCAVNGAYVGWVKVGVTRNDPIERMKQLSAGSGVPTPFVLAYSRKVRDPFAVEGWLHERLAAHRVNDAREFFQVQLHEAIKLIETFDEVKASSASYLETPFAELFAAFPDDGSDRALTPDEQAACRALEGEMEYVERE